MFQEPVHIVVDNQSGLPWLEILYYIISTLAFLLSLYNLYLYQCSKRIKYTFHFQKLYLKETVKNYMGENHVVVLLSVSIVNSSEQPISITKIALKIKENYYNVQPLPHLVEHETEKENYEIVRSNLLYSDKIPINLSGYEAWNGFLAYLVPEGSLSKNEKSLTFQICASRHESIEISLLPDEEFQVDKKSP
jgi:hypothetical protein